MFPSLNFTFLFHGVHFKKLQITQLIFEVARGKKLVLNNKDNKVFMSRNY